MSIFPEPMAIKSVEIYAVCDCCQREFENRYSHTSCSECFGQWYDPDNSSFDHLDPVSIGNYVRAKHGLPPLEKKP